MIFFSSVLFSSFPQSIKLDSTSCALSRARCNFFRLMWELARQIQVFPFMCSVLNPSLNGAPQLYDTSPASSTTVRMP